MIKNMKLSKKISLGFTSILFIAVILGLIAILNMSRSGSNAKKLDKEFVPSVALANRLTTSSNNIMLAVRSYGLSGIQTYYDTYTKELQSFNEVLEEFEKLSQETKNIPELKNDVNDIKGHSESYKMKVEETKKINDTLENLRAIMDTNAKVFMTEAETYLENQTGKLKEEMNQKLSSDKLNERLEKITWINQVIDLGNETRIGNFKSQALRDVGLLEGAIGNFVKINEIIDKIKAKTVQEVNMVQLEKIRTAGENYKQALIQFESTWKARTELEKVRSAAGDDLLAAIDKVASLGLDTTKSVASTTNTSLSISTIIMALGLTLAVILGVTLSVVIVVSITKSINQIVNSLKSGAEQVFQASEQLSGASQSLAEGSSEQAAAIEETSSTLDETSSMVQQNTENTKQAAVLSNNAKETADKGNTEMEEMMRAMNDIKSSSSEISKIIKVIDDIAFQTNILALNAAVEAAGAGEAGMGFAVVAEEVRNLAQRSAQAAKDTSDMIETSILRANKGADIAEKVSHSLVEIREQAKKVNEIMNEITTASQEQAQGIFQINKAVNQMEQVTQSIASGAEESASSSEELSAQAESLMEIVNNLILLVEGENGAKSHTMKKSYKIDSKHEKGYIAPKAIKRSTILKKDSQEFSPETIIPLNEDSTDF